MVYGVGYVKKNLEKNFEIFQPVQLGVSNLDLTAKSLILQEFVGHERQLNQDLTILILFQNCTPIQGAQFFKGFIIKLG